MEGSLALAALTVVTVGLLGWGAYIGSRRELIWSFRHRAERAEAEQELRATQARANERARIAREMHDVLAHRISQVSMHAGALAFRTDLDADGMRASATIIQDTAHQALADLRSVLGVLRDPESGEPLEPPQPTYADLAPLVEAVRAAGLQVTYADRLGPSATQLPDVIGRTLYRIVQEGMTNAAKHAPGCNLEIEVHGSPDEGVTVELHAVDWAPVGRGTRQAGGADGGGEVARVGVGGIGVLKQAADAGAQDREGSGSGRRRARRNSFVQSRGAGASAGNSLVHSATAGIGRSRPCCLALRWARKARCARWVAMLAAVA